MVTSMIATELIYSSNIFTIFYGSVTFRYQNVMRQRITLDESNYFEWCKQKLFAHQTKFYVILPFRMTIK